MILGISIDQFSPCNISSGSDESLCHAKIMRSFDTLERLVNFNSWFESTTDFSKCPCEVGCHDRNFQSQISSSTWPSNQYWKLLALDVGTYDADDINAGGPKGDLIQQTIKEDFARWFGWRSLSLYHNCDFYRVEVYYQTLNVQSIIQSEKYTVSSLIRHKEFMNVSSFSGRIWLEHWEEL